MGVALAPFWFGGDRPVIWLLTALYFGLLVFCFEAGSFIMGRPHPVALRMIWPSAALFGFICVWLVVQTCAFAPSGWEQPVWKMAREALGDGVESGFSVNRDKTYWTLLRLLTLGCAFWLIVQLCRNPFFARRMIAVVAISGAVYAFYGIIAFFLFPKTTLWFEKTAYRDALTSVFVNRNSYATYAGLGLVSTLTFMLQAFEKTPRPPAKGGLMKIAYIVSFAAGPGGLWAVAAFILTLALILTGSRGGVAAVAMGVFALFALTILRRRGSTPVAVAAFSAAFLVCVGVGAAGDILDARMGHLELDAGGRMAAYRLTVLSIKDSPWVGYGYGSFQNIFSLYRDGGIGALGVWDMAHNSYLDLFQGLGAPAALLFLLAPALLALRCVAAIFQRAQGLTAPMAASAATVIVALHAMTDFSMEIQSVALTWTAMLAAGVAQSWSSRRSLSDQLA